MNEDDKKIVDFSEVTVLEDNKKEIVDFSPEATDFLLKYEWPGNVRELENAVERAVILANNSYIEARDMPKENVPMNPSAPLERSLRESEKKCILTILKETRGNFSESARILGISRATLYNKIKAYGLNVKNLDNS